MRRKLSIRQIVAIAASSIVAIILLCLLTDKYILGSVGSAVSLFFRGLFGLSAYTLFISAQIILAFMIFDKRINIKTKDKVNFIVMYCLVVGLVHTITSSVLLTSGIDYNQYLADCFNFPISATFGGVIAAVFIFPLVNTISLLGAYLFIGALLLASGIIASIGFLKNSGKGFSRFFVQPVKENNDLFVANASGIPVNMSNMNNRTSYNNAYNQGNSMPQQFNNQQQMSQPVYQQPMSVQQPMSSQQSMGYNQQPINNNPVNQQIYPQTPNTQSIQQPSGYNKLYQEDLTSNIKINSAYVSPIDNIDLPSRPPKIVHNDTTIVVEPFSNDHKSDDVPLENKSKPQPNKPLSQPRTIIYNKDPIIDGDSLSLQIRQEREKAEKLKQAEELAALEKQRQEQQAAEAIERSKSPRQGNRIDDPGIINTPSYKRAGSEIVSQEEFDLGDDRQDIVVEEFPYDTNEYLTDQDDQAENSFNDYDSFNEVSSTPKTFRLPPMDLLDDIKTDYAAIKRNVGEYGEDIVKVLDTYGIPAVIQNTIVGPTVTCFELELAQGIAISKVERVATDITRGIGAEEEVRIIPQIAGKKYFGIEVPNKVRAMIGLKHVLSAPAYQEHSLKSLTFGLGVDISGNQITPDLADMPHLLIAGATGSGKSICMNGILISLMMKYTPSELRFILIDPKQVEFTIYRNTPHLLTEEVITQEKHAVKAFDWLIAEMHRRYTLFNKSSRTQIIKDIVTYNKYARSASLLTLPRIVLVVDELSQLMSYDKNTIDDRIKQLSQLARSAGIHLIIATQRASIDVITGTVKANFTSRIALKLKSSADARTIMEGSDPGTLLGDGDMLYVGPKMNVPVRLQGAYASNSEIEKIIMYLRDYNDCEYDETIRKAIFSQVTTEQNRQPTEKDVRYFDALGEFINKGKASVSMLQSIFSMGYNRAKRIVDTLAAEGYISEDEDSVTRTRKVLISRADFEKLIDD